MEYKNLEMYKLDPDGYYQVTVSGGRSSAYQTKYLLEANPWLRTSKRVIFNYCNTGLEVEETLEFLHKMETEWDFPLTWLELDLTNPNALPLDQLRPDNITNFYGKQLPNGKWSGCNFGKSSYKITNYHLADRKGLPFLKSVLTHKMLPTVVSRYCSQDLKARVVQRYIRQKLKWKEWTVILGLRADEEHRLVQNQNVSRNNNQKWYPISPMIDAGVDKHDVADFWRQQPFDLGIKSELGNCASCMLKSQYNLGLMYAWRPETFDFFSTLEREVSKKFGLKHVMRRGESYDELKKVIDSDDAALTREGFLCQATDGAECMGNPEDLIFEED